MKFPDLIKTSTTSTGTGSITVASGAPAGFQSFMSGLAIGDSFGYKIGDAGAAEFETGIGTVTAANTFSRAPETSSNGNALVNFGAGSKTVIVTVTGGQVGKMATSLAPAANSIIDPTTWTLAAFDAAGVPKKISFSDMLASLGTTVGGLNAAAALAGTDVVPISQDGGVTEVKTNLTAIAAYVASTLVTPATAVTLTGPTSGTVGVASSSFTVGANGAITGTVVVTPSDGGAGGTFNPTSKSISSATPTGAFTYTPASTGAKTISVTNNGGLANPGSITYTSNAAGDTTAPTASSAAVANATPTVINVTMSEALDTGFVPAASAFAVGGHTVSSVGISGSTINLTCSTPFVNGEAARTVAYTQPGTNNARDLAGNLLASFSGLSVTNNVAATDTTAPTATSAAVANATPTVVNITMSEAMDTGFVPAASAFAVGGHTVSSVNISGSTLNLTCSAAFVNGEAARTVDYTQPGTNNARDLAGNLLANFSALSITNNVAGGTTYTISGYSGNVVKTALSSTAADSTQGTLRGFLYGKTMTTQYWSVSPTPPSVGGSTVKAGWGTSSTVAPAEVTQAQHINGASSVNGMFPVIAPGAAYNFAGYLWIVAGAASANWYFWIKPSDGPAQCMNPSSPLVVSGVT